MKGEKRTFSDLRIGFNHAITYPDFCENILGVRRILFNFSADIGHIHPQNLVAAMTLGPPEFLQNEIIGQNFSGTATKQCNYLKLILGKPAVFITYGYHMLIIVYRQITGDKFSAAGHNSGRSGMAYSHPYAGKEFRR